jgi:hypothetical protein
LFCSFLPILITVALPLAAVPAPAAETVGGSNTASAQASYRYGALPSSFEQNLGQASQEVRYLARGAGYSILLDRNDAVLLLSHRHPVRDRIQRDRRALASPQNSTEPADLLRMRLDGSRASAALTGEDRLPGVVNYLLGNDPSKWLTGVPTFGRVTYTGVYPGIDLTYYGSGQRLEFDFDLAPGADPHSIRLRFDGARSLRLDKDGSLVIAAAHGQVSFQKPAFYQPSGKHGRQPVEGAFRIVSRRTVAFTLGRYDRTKPLVIDPILNYSTYFGQSGQAYAITVDAAGEAFVAGSANAGMPTTAGIEPNLPTKALPSDTSAFVAKLNSSGTAVVYCTYLGGSKSDVAYGVALDAAENAYVGGWTFSADFPVTAGAFQTINHAANGAGFVAAINSTGTALVYSTFLSGSQQTEITGVAADSVGEAFVTGDTYDLDFPTTAGAYQSSPKADPDEDPEGFITKLNAAGTGLIYSTYIGGSGGDYPGAITLDANGDAYIAGYTESSDFPTTQGAFQTAMKHGWTGFVTQVNPSGSALVYSTFLGGSRMDGVQAIAVDSSGDAYVTGYANSDDFPVTSGVFQPKLNLGSFALAENAFITRLNSTGTALVYSTYLGGSKNGTGGAAEDAGVGIAVDGSGNAYVTGATPDIDFPVTQGAFESQNLAQLNSADGATFLTKINPTASQILYSTYFSGSGDNSGETCDCASGIALDPAGNVYLAGWTVSTDFPSTQGAFQTQMGGEGWFWSTFVTEFNEGEMTTLPASTTTLSSSGNGQDYGQSVTFTASVQPTSGSTPTGTVGFSVMVPAADGNAEYGMGPWTTVPLNNSGVATYTTSDLITGQVPIVAYYLGDTNNAPSSGTMTETVNQIPTTTTITSSANPAPYGQPLTFTVNTTETATGNPAQGYVQLSVGKTGTAQITLNSAGQAVWQTNGTALSVGVNTITVNFYPAEPVLIDHPSSASLVETVTSTTVTPAPTFSPPGGTYTSYQQVTLNDTASDAAIYYTLDGSTPVVGSSNQLPAGSQLEVTASETIEAIAQAPGDAASAVVSTAYVINLPQPDFTFTLNPTSLTINSGGTGTTTITVTAIDGFSGSVSFACSGLPSGASCGFSPFAVTPGNSSTLTITVPASTSSNRGPVGSPFMPTVSLALIVGWLGLRGKRSRRTLLFTILFAVGLLSFCACGGGGTSSGGQNPPPTQTTSTVTVSATSGSLSHTATLTLTVN